jgi:hypothetical protein
LIGGPLFCTGHPLKTHWWAANAILSSEPVKAESTMRRERAKPNESAMQDERAKMRESAIQRERAKTPESTKETERAKPRESTNYAERPCC